MTNTRPSIVHSPEEAANRLGGISVAQLVAILKSHGYDYTQLMPGSKPWGRGRQVWGMTDDQLADLIAGQARRHVATGDAATSDDDTSPEQSPATSGLRSMGWDGVSRVRKVNSRPSRPKKR